MHKAKQLCSDCCCYQSDRAGSLLHSWTSAYVLQTYHMVHLNTISAMQQMISMFSLLALTTKGCQGHLLNTIVRAAHFKRDNKHLTAMLIVNSNEALCEEPLCAEVVKTCIASTLEVPWRCPGTIHGTVFLLPTVLSFTLLS